jgi:hypothetical protein
VKRRGKKRAQPQAAKKKPQAAKGPQAVKKKPKAAAKRKTARRARPAPKPARPAKRRAKARPAKKPAVAAKKIPPPAVDFERELKRERANRRKLEKRLTALVQELGQVRMYEVRCGLLEEEVRKRDEELAALRRANAAGLDPQAELPLGAP